MPQSGSQANPVPDVTIRQLEISLQVCCLGMPSSNTRYWALALLQTSPHAASLTWHSSTKRIVTATHHTMSTLLTQASALASSHASLVITPRLSAGCNANQRSHDDSFDAFRQPHQPWPTFRQPRQPWPGQHSPADEHAQSGAAPEV